MARRIPTRTWLAALLLPSMACEEPLSSRAEGLPIAPGEEREAAPDWRLRDGLMAHTVVESGEPLTHDTSARAPRLPARIDGLRFDPERSRLWIDHGTSQSELQLERDEAHDWVLALTTANTLDEVDDAAAPHAAGCRWAELAVALGPDGQLDDGAPIVMYALAADSPAPFKLVTKTAYENEADHGHVSELLEEASVFVASTDRHAGRWLATSCPRGGDAARASARHLAVERGGRRAYFSNAGRITMLEESLADRPTSSRFASTTVVRFAEDARVPLVTDDDGALWFAAGDQLFRLDAAAESATPERVATAPNGSAIVAMAWNSDESALFLGLEQGATRASVVALSAP